jgi:hypothetical protein
MTPAVEEARGSVVEAEAKGDGKAEDLTRGALLDRSQYIFR